MTRLPRRFFAFGALSYFQRRVFHRRFATSAASLLAAAALLALFADAPHPASAQGADCGALRAQIADLDRASTRANPYAGTIRSDRARLQKTTAYAHQIGCDRQQFLFFGSPPPPQCGQLNEQIAQLRGSLAQLEDNARAIVDSPRRQQLVASYNAYCERRSAGPQPGQGGGFFGSLFGGPSAPPPGPGEAPPPDALPPPDVAAKPAGGSEMLCVRHCDGSFFPITDAPGRDEKTLTDFCQASCPNAEVSVYSRVPGQAIQTAVGLDGKPYMSLPAALKYQKVLVPSCSCRAPGASWAQTLAGAEAMLSHSRKGEIVVTQAKSDEMARPTSHGKKRHAAVSGDDLEDQDAAAAAQVPTASTDSAGISAGNVNAHASFPQGTGHTTEVTGSDGVTRAVRTVGP